MEKLTFKRQSLLAFGIMLCCFLLSSFSGRGVFANIGWILSGALFIAHPVCPEAAQWRYAGNEKRLARDCRIGGGIAVIIGLVTRFGF